MDSSQSNGSVETFHGSMQAMARTLISVVESAYKIKVNDKHVLLPWLVRHAAYLYVRYQVGPDGKTPFHRCMGVPYSSNMIPFAETVLGKLDKSHRSKLDVDWYDGIFVGRSTSSDEYLLPTKTRL